MNGTMIANIQWNKLLCQWEINCSFYDPAVQIWNK